MPRRVGPALMRFVFSPEARAEFVEAERYYERQAPGLGRRFREEKRSGLRRVRDLAPVVSDRARRNQAADLAPLSVQDPVFDSPIISTCWRWPTSIANRVTGPVGHSDASVHLNCS